MQLRPYQNDFIADVEKGWEQYRKQLGVAPTGSGKTIIFSWLAKRLHDSQGKRTLILAHRDELIGQAIDKLHAATGIVAAKEKADSRASRDAPVVVASIQTMMRRADQWPEDHFGLVVCDEAHHSLSESWQNVLTRFDSKANVLGVTATPDRGDKRELGSYYENIAHEISLIDLVRQAFLCPISICSLPLSIDLSAVKSTAGDLDSGDLGHALEPYLKSIARTIGEAAKGRKTLCFLPLIATSLKFVEHCQAAGISCKHVDGESPDRAQILKEFAAGEFQLLSNAMLLTEGYDCPDIGCICVLRPTRSRPLFAQMVGRGTRIAEGKENLLILDFIWLHERHKLIKPAHLICESEEEAEEITETMAEYGGDADLVESCDQVRAERESALAKRLALMASRTARFISAEEFAVRHHRLSLAEFEPTMKWHSQPITDKQSVCLERAGINVDTVKGKGHASQIIGAYFEMRDLEPASAKQKWVMQQRGWMSSDGMRNAQSATSGEAREFFTKLNAARTASAP